MFAASVTAGGQDGYLSVKTTRKGMVVSMRVDSLILLAGVCVLLIVIAYKGIAG